jgi:hypothetical protein
VDAFKNQALSVKPSPVLPVVQPKPSSDTDKQQKPAPQPANLPSAPVQAPAVPESNDKGPTPTPPPAETRPAPKQDGHPYPTLQPSDVPPSLIPAPDTGVPTGQLPDNSVSLTSGANIVANPNQGPPAGTPTTNKSNSSSATASSLPTASEGSYTAKDDSAASYIGKDQAKGAQESATDPFETTSSETASATSTKTDKELKAERLLDFAEKVPAPTKEQAVQTWVAAVKAAREASPELAAIADEKLAALEKSNPDVYKAVQALLNQPSSSVTRANLPSQGEKPPFNPPANQPPENPAPKPDPKPPSSEPSAGEPPQVPPEARLSPQPTQPPAESSSQESSRAAYDLGVPNFYFNARGLSEKQIQEARGLIWKQSKAGNRGEVTLSDGTKVQWSTNVRDVGGGGGGQQVAGTPPAAGQQPGTPQVAGTGKTPTEGRGLPYTPELVGPKGFPNTPAIPEPPPSLSPQPTQPPAESSSGEGSREAFRQYEREHQGVTDDPEAERRAPLGEVFGELPQQPPAAVLQAGTGKTPIEQLVSAIKQGRKLPQTWLVNGGGDWGDVDPQTGRLINDPLLNPEFHPSSIRVEVNGQLIDLDASNPEQAQAIDAIRGLAFFNIEPSSVVDGFRFYDRREEAPAGPALAIIRAGRRLEGQGVVGEKGNSVALIASSEDRSALKEKADALTSQNSGNPNLALLAAYWQLIEAGKSFSSAVGEVFVAAKDSNGAERAERIQIGLALDNSRDGNRNSLDSRKPAQFQFNPKASHPHPNEFVFVPQAIRETANGEWQPLVVTQAGVAVPYAKAQDGQADLNRAVHQYDMSWVTFVLRLVIALRIT